MSAPTTIVIEFYRHAPGDIGVMDTVRRFDSVDDARAHAHARLEDLSGDPGTPSHQRPSVARLSDGETGLEYLKFGVTSRGIQEIDPDDAHRT